MLHEMIRLYTAHSPPVWYNSQSYPWIVIKKLSMDSMVNYSEGK